MVARSIILTGGFGALGSAVADHFEANGDRVARIDYAPAPDGSPSHYIGRVDLSDMEAAGEAVERAIAAIGPPSVLVNIAGGFIWETLADGEPQSWQRMFTMNTLTAVTMCKLLAPILADSGNGAIINIGAAAAAKAGAGMGAYTASKAGVVKLTESLAAELVDKNVTVNAVLPTIIDTPANRSDMPDADFSSWVKAQDIAGVIGFLASPAARCISGAAIPLSCGGG